MGLSHRIESFSLPILNLLVPLLLACVQPGIEVSVSP